MVDAGKRFARAARSEKGYATAQVDAFLARVEGALRGDDEDVDPAEVRRAGFDLVREGYDVQAVDAYLDQLERWALDLQSGREDDAPVDLGQRRAALVEQLSGEDRRRFPRASRVKGGYHAAEVDAFCERVLAALPHPGEEPDAEGPSADEVRQVVFHPRFGGYDETAVDDALDAVVDYLLRLELVTEDAPPPAHPR